MMWQMMWLMMWQYLIGYKNTKVIKLLAIWYWYLEKFRKIWELTLVFSVTTNQPYCGMTPCLSTVYLLCAPAYGKPDKSVDVVTECMCTFETLKREIERKN